MSSMALAKPPVSKVYTLTISEAPPSVNAMWRAVVRGKKAVNILSERGRNWKDLAAKELASQKGMGCEPCYWRADVLIPGKGSRADIDNYAKGILDALGASGKTPDDRYLVDLRLRFHAGPNVKIAIKQEELSKRATIKNASKSLIRKLARCSA